MRFVAYVKKIAESTSIEICDDAVDVSIIQSLVRACLVLFELNTFIICTCIHIYNIIQYEGAANASLGKGWILLFFFPPVFILRCFWSPLSYFPFVIPSSFVYRKGGFKMKVKCDHPPPPPTISYANPRWLTAHGRINTKQQFRIKLA